LEVLEAKEVSEQQAHKVPKAILAPQVHQAVLLALKVTVEMWDQQARKAIQDQQGQREVREQMEAQGQ
jgi:hypothetical protein